eukprot:TRINITY_DN1857_c0_g1_i1.p1 TRINITY_DN1857_c0_g1~~TRINITY_DN1857_c0_g1_i1.p1  ORF type:complete len:104 (-),score=13.04 TRINITY_DN1857_c0_g1_i1:257-535(-)
MFKQISPSAVKGLYRSLLREAGKFDNYVMRNFTETRTKVRERREGRGKGRKMKKGKVERKVFFSFQNLQIRKVEKEMNGRKENLEGFVDRTV